MLKRGSAGSEPVCLCKDLGISIGEEGSDVVCPTAESALLVVSGSLKDMVARKGRIKHEAKERNPNTLLRTFELY